MFKRFSLVLAAVAMAGLTFTACEKKAEQAPAPAAAAAAPVADAAAPAAQPDGQLPPPGAPMPPPGAPMPPPGAQMPLPPVPPEAQAAVDALVDVMGMIAAAGQKGTCAEVLSEVKKLQNNDEVKNKLLSTKVLAGYPEEIQRSINEANQQRLLGLAFQMQAFNKCQKEPESAEIDAVVRSILEPIAPEEAAPAAPAAPAAAPAPTPEAAAAPAPAAPAPTPEAAAAPAPAPAAAPAPEAAAPGAAAPSPKPELRLEPDH